MGCKDGQIQGAGKAEEGRGGRRARFGGEGFAGSRRMGNRKEPRIERRRVRWEGEPSEEAAPEWN